jgi:DNA-binding PadR family transcriptional regulator
MKNLFLSLLSRKPTHGYDLLQTYQALFSLVLPPLNAGQIYTTLARMERDGLVKKYAVEQEGKPDKQIYELTEKGRQVLLDWFGAPISGPRIKDNFYMKLMSARLSHLADTRHLINIQRQHYLQNLHDLNNLYLQNEVSADPTRLLLIQGAILHLKADLEWLKLCEDEFVEE